MSVFKNKRILVAEDDMVNQLLLKHAITSFGADVDIVDNGRLAIKKMDENQYDLLVTDIHMPQMNGFETSLHIREKLKNTIPIIALTAELPTERTNKYKEAGMTECLSKPFTLESLSAIMEKAFLLP